MDDERLNKTDSNTIDANTIDSDEKTNTVQMVPMSMRSIPQRLESYNKNEFSFIDRSKKVREHPNISV